MLKGTLAASTLVLSLSLIAPPAHASGGTESVVPPSPSAFRQTVATVESRPSPAGIIVRDAFGGAVLGAAVGGGVAAYRRYVSDEKQWGNWQRDVGIGAGIGLAAGLILGAVDAASSADRTFTGPIADQRDVGFAPASPVYGVRF